MKKKRFSILKMVIVVICIILIIVCAAVNILFSKNKTPHILGRYIYVVDESNPMGSDITTGDALISKEASDVTISAGDIVLCYPADDPENLVLRSINAVVEAEDGTEKYYTRDSRHEDNTDSITKDRIAAICTGYPASAELGALIRFATDMKGIIAMLVAPCVLLVIFLIAKVASKGSEDDDDEYEFYEYDDEDEDEEGGRKSKKQHKKPSEPLYEPGTENEHNDELERKKLSIAENFSQKQVNSESPYQKEKERTMQFRAQKGNQQQSAAPVPQTGSAESNFAARNKQSQSQTAPIADALREEMLRRTEEAERTSTFSIKPSPQNSDPVDNTGILSKAQLEQMSREDPAPKPQPKPAPKPHKSSTPDISDILKQTSMTEKKKNPSAMSVDDLLKMIEEEKKKL